ncbi:hypothetical protein ACRAWD_10105 [Caulobacter segnis]
MPLTNGQASNGMVTSGLQRREGRRPQRRHDRDATIKSVGWNNKLEVGDG